MPEREQRKLTTILAADVAGFSRLVGADEEGTLRRLRALRAELIDPAIAANRGRVFHTAGDSILIEFASVVDAARAAIDVQRAMARHNADFVPEKRIEFRVGIHLGDVVVEADGNLLGDGVNIAARLEGIAAPGGICLSEPAYWQVRDKIDAAFADLGERELKNIARPMRVYAIEPSSPSRRKPGPTGIGNSPGRTVDPDFRRGGEQRERAEQNQGGPPRLSIVVLPFANLGGDPEQEYFVDGVTESLTTDLSRISGSFVIARNTAFTYKGKPIDVKQIGSELGVRYILEGSVQRGGNRLRVNVQLIDAETGNHLWAERFDKPVADLFDMQDEIVARLANQLNAELVTIEARRAEKSPHPDSMALYFQGTAAINKGATHDNLATARGYYERALALASDNVEAMVGLARIAAVSVGTYLADDRAAQLAAAESLATRALTLAPNHAFAHYVLAMALIHTNRNEQGIAECEHALALDRNLALAQALIGGAKFYLGRGAETEAHVVEALRLSPRDITTHVWMATAGCAKLGLREDDRAIAWLRRSLEANRNLPVAHFFLAAALAHVGRIDEARAAARAGLALDPSYTLRRFRDGASSDNPVYLAQRDIFADGMRQAGVPEG